MPNPNDNRMQWIRNLESLASATHEYVVEYELGSECHIPGLLNYDNQKIICGPLTTEKAKNGLFLYNLRVKYPFGGQLPNVLADEKGYVFKDGVVGELISLMSLHFRCRFYLLSSRRVPEDPARGMTIKREYSFLYEPCNPAIHPAIFRDPNKNFATDFSAFLDSVKQMTTDLHQEFILSAYHYARALREVGIDSEMVFVRLVSAVEAVSGRMPLKGKIDVDEAKKIRQLIKTSSLSKQVQQELFKAFSVRGSKKRFVHFIETHCAGYFKGGNFAAPRMKIKKADLPKILTAIYNARSAYLHAGGPMYLSMPIKGGERWDTDPTLGMTIDNRQFSADEKLPYGYFFEGLVRHCLLNYLKANIVSLQT